MGFDCHECDEQLQKERGCIEKGIVPFYIEDERYFRCPLKLITQISWEYIQAFNFYQKNLLPNGRWPDESQKFLDAMVLLDNEYKKNEIEAIKRNKNAK
jgi:hypothetical protein